MSTQATATIERAEPTADPEPRAVAPEEPASEAIRAALADGLDRLRAHDESARRGEAEGVHRLRTSSRRLRSAIRAFRPLVEPGWADRLIGELKWIAGLLGAVRDLDVLRARLRTSAAESAEALGPLFTALADRHAEATEALHEALGGDRYRALVALLGTSAERPLLLDEAEAPCRDALPSIVADAWETLRKQGRSLTTTGPDEAYHEVRKRAKRARYTAESVAPALGPAASKDARRLARRASKVQDVLGEHQDAVVACQEIRRLVADRPHDGPFNLAAGRLLERQEVAAAASRARFFGAWRKLDRKKVTRWLKD